MMPGRSAHSAGKIYHELSFQGSHLPKELCALFVLHFYKERNTTGIVRCHFTRGRVSFYIFNKIKIP